MEAYFDNAATTRVAPEVQDIIKQVMDVDYGNPSSRHQKGVDAGQYIKEAQEIIAKTLKVDAKEILFTSGGTESNKGRAGILFQRELNTHPYIIHCCFCRSRDMRLHFCR